jgi:hypothetical protein
VACSWGERSCLCRKPCTCDIRASGRSRAGALLPHERCCAATDSWECPRVSSSPPGALEPYSGVGINPNVSKWHIAHVEAPSLCLAFAIADTCLCHACAATAQACSTCTDPATLLALA